MIFHKSTRSVVEGNVIRTALRSTKAIDPNDPELETELGRIHAARKKLGLVIGVPLVGLALVGSIYFLWTPPVKALGSLDGKMAVSLETGLSLTTGDVVGLYTDEGAIPALRYVEVQEARGNSVTLYLTDSQLQSFLSAGQITPVLLIHQEPEAAAQALTLQEQWNSPEISLEVPETLTVDIAEGGKLKAVVNVTPEGAIAPTVEYRSSDSKVISVDEKGSLTPNALGTAEITVSCGEEQAHCTVTVLQAAQELSFESEEITIGVGGSAALVPLSSPSEYTEGLTWTSSDETVATVDRDGTVTGLGEGETTITVSGMKAKASYTLLVRTEVTSISLSRDSIRLEEGESGALAAAVAPQDATDKTVTWTTEDDTVATVDSHGTVIAVGAGETTITAVCGTVSASCTVTVTEKEEDSET